MSFTPIIAQEFRVDALAIIADSQPYPPFVIVDFHFNLLRVRVTECVAHGFPGNSVDLVAKNRMQIARRALQLNIKFRLVRPAVGRREFSAKRFNRQC